MASHFITQCNLSKTLKEDVENKPKLPGQHKQREVNCRVWEMITAMGSGPRGVNTGLH